ncbi:hypothetical protein [Lentzea sp. NEAU-D7]|uniref:hypothetical protein n=1 Tax=Lentzea sp. NEAU-D7 TaxID=2994667 RepID=UPI00224B558F|nr:hypothetical protein [Lentzea sp. NEAU-D7]MCX2955147.1 hypothetical protein [Lentzea sp. NEAU-D7]
MARTGRSRRLWRGIALSTAALMLTGTASAVAAPGPGPNNTASKPLPKDPPAVAAEKRQEVLGKDWQKSDDKLWTTMGDQTGFHVMVATAKSGYAWKTVATLNQPAVEADLWIGNACVTGSGDRVVVAYAPRTYTNKEVLMARGAFTATVDLNTGAVTKLPIRTTLAYFSPGCGLDETAVLTQDATEDKGQTGLVKVDATSGKLQKRIELTGQVTSAVPTRDGIVAVAGASVQRIADDGKRTRLTNTTKGSAFYLKPDAEGGVVYLEGDDKTNRVKRIATNVAKETAATTLAEGKAGEVGVARMLGGKVAITGKPGKVEKLPSVVSKMDVPADAQLSLRGEAVVTAVNRADGGTPGVFSKNPGKAEPVHIKAKSTKTGKDIGFTVDPAATAPKPQSPQPAVPAPSAGTQSEVGAQAANQDMSDPLASCAIKRNDLSKQVYQPKPKQVEWAANFAVNGALMTERPTNWHNNGQAAYAIQAEDMFPSLPLRGGGKVPVQVMLGILGQESNLWQATRLVLPGEYANPLVGNFYGNDVYNKDEADDWTIDFSQADCGYGVSQTTDGMRLAGRERPGEIARSYRKQVIIATDYAANVAAGLQILQEKWNQLQYHGVRMNNNDPSKLENWFGAVWAYNSGFHAPGKPDSNGAFGLGWGNNPANPRYPENRQPFGAVPSDYARPNQWPYPEKVMGFAGNPPSGFEDEVTEVPFFRTAWWNGEENKKTAKPGIYTFCKKDKNECDENGPKITPDAPEVIGEPAGHCAHKNTAGQYDLKCWWHDAAEWKTDCSYTCGNQFFRYYPDFGTEPDDGVTSRPTCDNAGLPGDASVVDDVNADTAPVFSFPGPRPQPRGCARPNIDRDGTFNIEFSSNSFGQQVGRMDLHQATSGYGGHTWFTHAYGNDDLGRKLKMQATWTSGRTYTSPIKVWVHQPKRSEKIAGKLVYTVHTADGPVQVTAPDPGSLSLPPNWVELGTYKFTDKPKVSLSNWNAGANGREIAFDAVAFMPSTAAFGDKVAKIINRNSGRCLVSSDGGASGRFYLTQKSCSGEFNDNWVFRLIRVMQKPTPWGPKPFYTYKIMNRVTGACMYNPLNTPEVTMGECGTANDVQGQLWETRFGFDIDNDLDQKIFSLAGPEDQQGLSVVNCSKEDDPNMTVIYVPTADGGQPGCRPEEFAWEWNIAKQG